MSQATWPQIVNSRVAFILFFQTVFFAVVASGQEDGLENLEEATRVKATAKNLNDLERVVELCEAALEAGLPVDDGEFAKQLLTATLYDHASRISSAVLDKDPPAPRWQDYRRLALADIDKILDYDEHMGEAHLLRARLLALPGGDIQEARLSARLAVDNLTDDDEKFSSALVVRGDLTKDEKQRLADYDEAIRLNPRNVNAWRSRGLYYLAQNKEKEALESFMKLLDQDPDNAMAHQAIAEVLVKTDKYDEAIEHLTKSIEINPDSSLGYTLRARIYGIQGKTEQAVADLDQALNNQPSNYSALLMRAQMRIQQSQFDVALDDTNIALRLRPGSPQALLMRCVIYSALERFDEAIYDVEQLVQKDPANVDLQMQLAIYNREAQRPSKAIQVYTNILEQDKESWTALRGRADAYLSVGKHDLALADYEQALKIKSDDQGLLNNFAWVLATSPHDNIRDGKRSVELARKACELTNYEKAHVLSTLAAAYAETGDFESARQWSSKAVEQEDPNSQQQLAAELEFYKQNKPWREKQETVERVETDFTDEDILDLQLEEDVP